MQMIIMGELGWGLFCFGVKSNCITTDFPPSRNNSSSSELTVEISRRSGDATGPWLGTARAAKRSVRARPGLSTGGGRCPLLLLTPEPAKAAGAPGEGSGHQAGS